MSINQIKFLNQIKLITTTLLLIVDGFKKIILNK